MSTKITLKTKRLILRPWREEDLHAFAQLNADPRVMEFFPSVRDLEESSKEYNFVHDCFEKYGWGFWAVSIIDGPEFIGFIGLKHANLLSTNSPPVEVGWRLAYDYWGKGYATEGALESLKFGFTDLNLNEIVSYTPVGNIRSRNVMEKIGMHHNDHDDFDHPKLPEGHHLQRHVLYRIECEEWNRINQQ
jgi:3-dehydroquinate dehydratase/shikimate dehydrogenase